MAEFESSAPVLLAPEGVRIANATARVARIGDLFRIAQRYLRSVHLERDFDDTPALRHYVVTPAAKVAAIFPILFWLGAIVAGRLIGYTIAPPPPPV